MKLRKHAYANNADVAIGGPQVPEGRDGPEIVFDPEHVGSGQWRARKRPKKGAVTVNQFVPSKKRVRERKTSDLEYPTLVASAPSEPLALVLAPSLVRGMGYKAQKPVEQLTQYEMGQELKNLVWLISSAEQAQTPDLQALRDMRTRLSEIREHLRFKQQLQLSLTNWKPGDELGKARGFGRSPELAAKAPGKTVTPGKHTKRTISRNTGRPIYSYGSVSAKVGTSGAAPSKPQKDAKPDRHTVESLAAHVGVPAADLESMAAQSTAAEFSAHLRVHKLQALIANGVHEQDLHNIHHELARKHKRR